MSIESLSPEYLLLALLGIIIHVLMTIVNRSDRKNPISMKAYFKDGMNYVRIFLAIASVFAILLMANDITDMLGVTLSSGAPAKSVFAFLAGYFNHAIIKDILKIFRSRQSEKDE